LGTLYAHLRLPLPPREEIFRETIKSNQDNDQSYYRSYVDTREAVIAAEGTCAGFGARFQFRENLWGLGIGSRSHGNKTQLAQTRARRGPVAECQEAIPPWEFLLSTARKRPKPGKSECLRGATPLAVLDVKSHEQALDQARQVLLRSMTDAHGREATVPLQLALSIG